MALPTISALPTAPNRSQDNATFAANADAFVASLITLRNELNAWANQLPSEVSGIDYNATSTTSLAIGTGSKSLMIETGKLLQVGQFVMIASTASPANYMMGQVTAHNRATGALTVNIISVSGTGTFSAWTISLSLAATIYATLTGSEALTNKTIDLASNTLIGTLAQFNAALSDGDFASIAALAASGGSNLVGFLQSGTGAVSRTVQDKARDTVNAKDFGAVGDGVATGEQVAINKALATNKDVEIGPGTYLLSDAIISTKPGQVIRGAGRHLTVLKVPATFNLSAVGVIYSNGGEPGIDLRDLTIEFVQPDTATRASLTAYPPAIYAQGAARFRVSGCRIIGARTGIDMRGNTGGAVISDLEISSFDYAVRIDGSLDSVRIIGLHHWPFGLTANQQSIFFDSTNVGVESGRCDDFHLSDGLFIGGGKQLKFINTGGGNTFGNIVNTDFDSFGAVQVDDGYLSFGECFWTVGNASVQALLQAGGNVRITNSQFQCSVATTNPLVQMSNNAYLKIVGCDWYVYGNMTAIGLAAAGGSATAVIAGNQFILPQNSSPAKAIVSVGANSRITFVDNRASDKGTGTGNLLSISVDNPHVVSGNAFMNWGLSMPATWTSARVVGNIAVAGGDFISNRVIGKLHFARYTGTSGAGGTVAIPHGIASGQYKILSAQAWFKGVGGEMQDCAIDYIDGTNIGVTGAGASVKVRVFVTYTETQDVW